MTDEAVLVCEFFQAVGIHVVGKTLQFKLKDQNLYDIQ